MATDMPAGNHTLTLTNIGGPDGGRFDFDRLVVVNDVSVDDV